LSNQDFRLWFQGQKTEDSATSCIPPIYEELLVVISHLL